MWLRIRLYLLLSLMFAIAYSVIVVAASAIGISGFMFYAILAVGLLLVQYFVGPKLVEMSMRVKYVSEEEYPKLHQMVTELAQLAGIPKPKVGISEIPIPNAFAFGRWSKDGRVCITKQIVNLLNKEELRAVLGHEISHLKHKDVATITMLSVIPLVLWYISWNLMFSRRRDREGNLAYLGLIALILYFVTNLLVLYGSRIREYYADLGSVRLKNAPHQLASALYKLVYGSARAPKESLKQIEGYKAFFANDPSQAVREIRELKQLDLDMSGTIDQDELEAMRLKEPRVNLPDKLMEILSTHPNMVKRIKHLSELAEPH